MTPRYVARCLSLMLSLWCAFAEICLAQQLLSSPPPEVVAEVPWGKGQPKLAAALRNDSLLFAVCRGPCAWADAVAVKLPAQVVAAWAASPESAKKAARVLSLGQGRRALHFSHEHEGQAWQSVVTAPLEGNTPFVVFSSGAQTSKSVRARLQLAPQADGTTSVLVGVVSSETTLCGREALLKPRLLRPETLRLARVRLQRLAKEERRLATRLRAEMTAAPRGQRVLMATSASTGRNTVRALTDGDLASSWREQRRGDGAGEFAVLRAPKGLELRALELVLATPETEQTSPIAPSRGRPARFWLVTDQSLFDVVVNSYEPGATVRVALPQPLSTACVAIVLQEAVSGHESLDVAVGIHEVTAETTLDADKLRDLVYGLNQRAKAAQHSERLLRALRSVGVTAIVKHFKGLGERGRARGLTLLKDAPCELTLPAFIEGLDPGSQGVSRMAVRGVKACGKEAGRWLPSAVATAPLVRLPLLAELLAEVAPGTAVETFVSELANAKRKRRRVLRAALAKAVERPQTAKTVRAQLGNPKLRRKAGIDFLRALGPRVTNYSEEASGRIQRYLAKNPSFRTRYLLLEPAVHLGLSDRRLRAFLKYSITQDEERVVRARAARLIVPEAELLSDVLSAVSDPEVRVREAAIENLAERRLEQARLVLLARLEADPWPIVRAASVRALGQLPVQADTIAALAERASDDKSSFVRRPALVVLGNSALGSNSALRSNIAEVIRRRFREDEDVHVRAAAALALGRQCDGALVDELTAAAEKLRALGSSEQEQILGRSALHALGRLAVPDLKQRLEQFFGQNVPVPIQRAARAALSHPEPCQ